MAQTVNPPRGMRDFLPKDKRHRERVARVIRDTFQAHGFCEIETPVMEDAQRLHAGLGGDNEKLAFAVMKRGLTVQDLTDAATPMALADLGLRFDLTVPLARFTATHRGQLPSVFRSIQVAPVWRAERPQAGRYRQFMQCDIDISGEAGVIAELELLAATGDTLTKLGVPDAYIRVNDRRILLATLDAAGVAHEARDGALITIDKLDKIGEEGVRAELDAAGIDGARVLALLHGLRAGEAPEGFDAEVLAGVRELMDAHVGIRLEFDPTLVRGMGYYTGSIFEIAHPELPYSIGGGGRYDGMIGAFSGTEVPAVGISLGFERLIDLVRLDDTAEAAQIALVVDKDVAPQTLMEIKRELVAAGNRVLVVKRAKNMQRVLAEVASLGAAQFALVRADSDPVTLEFKPLARDA